nr:hypothetical protein [Parahaliea mediterranea]
MVGIVEDTATNLIQNGRAFVLGELDVGFGDIESFQRFAAPHTAVAEIDPNSGAVDLNTIG